MFLNPHDPRVVAEPERAGISPEWIEESVRLTPAEIEAMYRLLAIAKYEHRYVIPSAAGSDAHRLDALATGWSLDSDGGPA